MNALLPRRRSPDLASVETITGLLQVGGVAFDERVAAAPLRPEDRAGLVALRPMDAVPDIRCDPKDHGGRDTSYP
jgi:hypothetical protein